MDLLDKLKEIENILDNKVDTLKIWELPFQSILSSTLLTIDVIDRSKGADTAADYCSRLSYLFKKVKAKSSKAASVNSTTAILKIKPEYTEDRNYLNAYAHLSLLMPQIHRRTLIPVKIEDKLVELEYCSPETEFAEIIDRIYGDISIQAMVSFPGEADLKRYLGKKVALAQYDLAPADFLWVHKMHTFYNKYFINIQVLPNNTFKEATGLTYEEYASLTAAFRAFGDFFLQLSLEYHSQALKMKEGALADDLMSEYFENIVVCVDFKFVGFFMNVSGLSKAKVLKGISFYLSIYSNNTKEAFVENSFCNEGFFPPFTLFDKWLIFSPHAVRYMLNVNNMLYSLNKKNQKFFDEKISKHLEPTLINQLEYVFQSMKGIRTKKNEIYTKSEIDLLVLSESEGVCIVIQVKSTIAPSSSRAVERVQGRALEGIAQIKTFNQLSTQEKLVVVNKAFGSNLQTLTFIDLLLVRSCAGSEPIWKYNDEIKIANYALVASIVAKKVSSNDFTIANFNELIKVEQEELLKKSNWKKSYENLIIGDYTIKFPNLHTDLTDLLSFNFKTYKTLPEFEQSHS